MSVALNNEYEFNAPFAETLLAMLLYLFLKNFVTVLRQNRRYFKFLTRNTRNTHFQFNNIKAVFLIGNDIYWIYFYPRFIHRQSIVNVISKKPSGSLINWFKQILPNLEVYFWIQQSWTFSRIENVSQRNDYTLFIYCSL
mgnify:CR=1 FL=1